MMNVTPAQAERLVQWLDTAERLTHLSNAQLADLLIEHVWAEMPFGSPQNALLEVVIARLKNLEKEPTL